MTSRPSSQRRAALLVALACATGCIGDIGGDARVGGAGSAGGATGSSAQGSGHGSGTSGSSQAPPSSAGPPGARPLRRLNRAELTNTLTDLLGVPATPPTELADVLADSGYQEGGGFSQLETAAFMEWTQSLAEAAATKVAPLSGCAAAPSTRAAEDACARTFITKFGRRAFRRPLTGTEVDDLSAFYADELRGALGNDYPAAIRGLVWLMIQSPRFLYHWERPPEPATARNGVVALSPHELAARLSYLFWASMPDDALALAADRGELATQAQVQAQARRLLGDDRGARFAQSFVLQWLGIGDVSRLHKADKYAFTPELGTAMLSESQRFVRDVFAKDGSLGTLLTSTSTTLDSAGLAKLYGVAGTFGATPKLVNLDPAQRSGLLTSASFLTAQALISDLNPIKRGLAVVEQLLCMVVPAPPNNVPPARAPDPTLSTRKRLEEHDKNACAAGCHSVFDPAGMAFEHYDGIGAYRTMDGGEPVDSHAVVRFPSGDSVAVADAVELSRKLAQSPDVRTCLTRQALRYVLRRPDGSDDAASVEAARGSIAQGAGDLRELIVAVTTTPAFLSRAPSPGETVTGGSKP